MRAGVLGGVALAFLTVACGKERAPASEPTAGKAAAGPAASGPGRVVVDEAGEPPRTALRYRLKAGSRDSYELRQTQKNRSGDAAHVTVQTTTMTADAEVLAVDSAGQATVKVSMRDMRARVEGMPSPQEALAGVRFHLAGRVSPTGAWTNPEFALDEDPSGRMKTVLEPMTATFGQMMGQISVQLPVEPVGVGARWRSEVSVKVLGVTMSASAITTVESIGEGRVVLRQTLTGEAKDQKMEMGEVLEMSTKGEGRVTISLSRFLPGDLETTSTTRSKMRIKAPDAPPRDMDVTAVSEMSVKRKE